MNKLARISKMQWVFMLIGIAMVILLVWAYATRPQEDSDTASTKHIMTYTDNTIREELNGKLIWELHAGKISVDADTQIASMEDILGTFYRQDGSKIEIKAQKAIYNQANSDMEITDGLSIISTDGMSIQTQKVLWNGKANTLTAEGGVVIKKGAMTASADKASSTDAFSRFKLEGNAKLQR